MLNIFSNVKNSIKELNNQLSDYKSQIEAKTAWLEKLRTGPITQAEAKEKALEGVRLEADKFLGFFSGGYGSNLQSPTKKLSRFDVFGAVPMGVDHNQITKESLYYLFQDQIEQRVCDAIDAMPWPDMDGLPPLSERPALIEKTIQELDKLHEEHAELVEQAEAAGIHVDRVFSDDKARKKWQMKQVEKAARDLEESGAYVGGKPLTSDDRR